MQSIHREPMKNKLRQENAAQGSGFTLIEVAVVLVIIGLLAGAIVIGRDLIATAQLMQFGSSIQSYQRATATFQLKYNALPGDMPNATKFWGTAAGGCPFYGNATPGAATCNGNGDGQIGNETYLSSEYQNGVQPEEWLFWQHLANAGLIAGQYTGDGPGNGGGSDLIYPGLTSPLAGFNSINGTGVVAVTYGAPYGAGLPSNNYIVAGAQYTGDYFGGEIFTPEQAGYIDTKFDDGYPFTGWINTEVYGYTWNCANQNLPGPLYGYRSDTVIVQQIDGGVNDSTGCNLYFKLQP